MGFSASWIGPAYDPKQDLGFFEFSLDFNLDRLPETLEVWISADPRYALLVNGELVARGPQRGDPAHWFYETLDLTPFLKVGPNRLVAEVANFGWQAPMAQHSVRTAFLFEAHGAFSHLSTPGDWQVRRRSDRSFEMMSDGVGEFYIDVGPGEIFELGADLVQDQFSTAHRICRAETRGQTSGGSPWNLIPRTLPIEDFHQKLVPVHAWMREGSKDTVVAIDDLELEAGKELLLDFGELLVGYPSIWLSHPNGVEGEVRIGYCESLSNEEGKGKRSELDGKACHGYVDLIRFKGADCASIHPSWQRTCRFVSVRASSDIERMTFEMVRAGYPMQIEASFETDEPSIQPIWDMCDRTLKLCAGETYYDCPYYEQLQYVGDTRLQALVGYYLSRDRRLQRNAIEQFHWSMMENGLTQSRYPSRQMQVIPPFSLWWVVMLYDAWMHDPGFASKPYLRSAQTVIESVLALQQGLTDDGPFWNFGDWVPNWQWGVPPLGAKAQMHRILLQMAMWCYMRISGLDYRVEKPLRAPDEPNTEHAEALWRYWQVLAGHEPDPWDETSLVGAERCTYFWQYVKHVGMQADDYNALLDPWRGMLELGLTTTPETPEPTRSDCHGWSAHPPLGLLQLVAGVTSSAPGWSKVRIAPHPGSLKQFMAVVPHPQGDIVVRFENGKYAIECPVEYEWVEP